VKSELLSGTAAPPAPQTFVSSVRENPASKVFTIPETVFTIPETARYLRASRSTVYDLIKTGKLQSLKLNRCRRVRREACDRLLAEQEGAA
jgi:excisionase family DNA binding protein